ncbi:MAG: pyridoxamine 5'-phosphate oxidase [Candidatus Dormibacteraeota bacterium]|nr:pyridoxamine 5'-phosphate oxidase [Candidatus Dormibacteraeota bacterium]
MALLESRVPAEPIALFRRWYRQAEHAGAPQPDAMTLATAGAGCTPSARMVLYKGIDEGAFLFFSNYESRKGRDLAANNKAALVFYWSVTRHQVRVSGTVRTLSRAASLAYFRSRPRGAQLSALASPQSRVIPSRDVLEQAAANLDRRHPDEVPLPEHWGGYALRPAWIEFWENRADRLHDRLRYVRTRGGTWRMERLAP